MNTLPDTAFVLGAGLGTRLKALTKQLPKPLIPVCNNPLITLAFNHLSSGGVRRFVINTHWQAHAYALFFPEGNWRGFPLHFSHESPDVLETGGGLKHAEALLPSDHAFWVYNGDILSSLPLEKAWHAHLHNGNEVTLVLRSKDGPLQIGLDHTTGLITDIGRRLHPERDPEFLFTGIYLVHPSFLQRIPGHTKIGVVSIFLEMIQSGSRLGGVVLDDGEWWDLGSREQVLAVHRSLAARGGAPWIAPDAVIHPRASVIGATAVGSGSHIGEGSVIEDSIVWSGARIAAGTILKGCIVTGNTPVSGCHADADL